MSQKYRVAIAIAVLKTKPSELTVNQYMDKIKNKLNEEMDVDVISINSNDFNFDEEVFNEFNESFNGANENDNSHDENNDCSPILGDVCVRKINERLDSERLNISNVLDVMRHGKQQVTLNFINGSEFLLRIRY